MAKISRPEKSNRIPRRTYQLMRLKHNRARFEEVPLVQGGQGREADETMFSAYVVFACLIGLGIICIIAGFMQ